MIKEKHSGSCSTKPCFARVGGLRAALRAASTTKDDPETSKQFENESQRISIGVQRSLKDHQNCLHGRFDESHVDRVYMAIGSYLHVNGDAPRLHACYMVLRCK